MNNLFSTSHLPLKIKKVPIPTTYKGPISSISFSTGVIYGLSVLWPILQYKLHQWKVITLKQFEKKGASTKS
jgi:hypothetical protein